MQLNFAVELYRMQLDAGRLFLHEHPLHSTSWDLQSMDDLMKDPRVIAVTAHQCMLGQARRDATGDWVPVKTPTRFLTNSPAIAARLDVQCDRSHPRALLGGPARGESRGVPPGALQGHLRGPDPAPPARAARGDHQGRRHRQRAGAEIQPGADPAGG